MVAGKHMARSQLAMSLLQHAGKTNKSVPIANMLHERGG